MQTYPNTEPTNVVRELQNPILKQKGEFHPGVFTTNLLAMLASSTPIPKSFRLYRVEGLYDELSVKFVHLRIGGCWILRISPMGLQDRRLLVSWEWVSEKGQESVEGQ